MRLTKFFKLDSGYLRNIGFQSGGNILAQAINIVSLPFITRLFHPADFGAFNLFMQFMALTTILISLRVEHVVMLPKTDDQAKELVGFVAGFGAMSCAGLTGICLGLVVAGLIPIEYQIWALILPMTSFLIVFAQAAQQLSQRSEDFRKSGMSEVANRAGNGLVSIGAGLLGLPGVWLGVATATGFASKILVVGGAFKSVSFAPMRGALTGRTRIRAQGLEKLLGSMILSHGMLAVTTLAPLTYIGYRYGEDFTGQFALVLGTLALPTTLVGNASVRFFISERHSCLQMAVHFRLFCWRIRGCFFYRTASVPVCRVGQPVSVSSHIRLAVVCCGGNSSDLRGGRSVFVHDGAV